MRSLRGGGNGGSVMVDEGLDGSCDKLRRDLATTGIDPPRAESRVLPSEPGRLFVYPRVTRWNRSIRRLCSAKPIATPARSIRSRRFHPSWFSRIRRSRSWCVPLVRELSLLFMWMDEPFVRFECNSRVGQMGYLCRVRSIIRSSRYPPPLLLLFPAILYDKSKIDMPLINTCAKSLRCRKFVMPGIKYPPNLNIELPLKQNQHWIKK